MKLSDRTDVIYVIYNGWINLNQIYFMIIQFDLRNVLARTDCYDI